MTPFGVLLRYHRNERGITLKELAIHLGASQKTLSAIETGRQRPLQGEQFDLLCDRLSLLPAQRSELADAANHSVAHLRIPDNATPREWRLAHLLMQSLGKLSSEQIESIHAALHRPAV